MFESCSFIVNNSAGFARERETTKTERQQSASCRAKYSEAKACVDSVIQKFREGISLLKEDRLKAFYSLVASVKKDDPCNILTDEADECCAAEGDCSLVEAAQVKIRAEMNALRDELMELDKADRDARQ